MEYIRLNPDLKVSRIITGLWQIADLEKEGRKLNPADSASYLQPYVNAGFTTFDMADHYGSAEDLAGEFRGSQDGAKAIFLTKWVPPPGPITKAMVNEAVEKALLRLKSEHIDLMQFHAWRYFDPSWLDALFELDELRKQGVITALGLTNFDAAHLNMVIQSGIQVVSNQVSYSLIDRRAAGEMTEVCHSHDIQLLAYGTLAGGFISESWLGKPEPATLASWSLQKYKRFIDEAGGWSTFQGLLTAVDKVAHACNASMAQVATRYMLDQPAVGAIIVGARLGECEHIEENKRILALKLSPEQKNLLQEAASALRPLAGECGDEYRKPPYLTASGDLSHHFQVAPPPYPYKPGADGRMKALSGTLWEDIGGFSRAVRKGNRIFLSGTTATHHQHAIGGDDPAAQAHFIIDKMEGAIRSLGGTLEHVVRTRTYVRNLEDWEAVARVHGKRFKDIQPANTLIRADLVGHEYLVEMEAEAIVE